MSFWAIVPVKPLRRGKSCLAGILTESERTLLNTSMLEHTLQTLIAVPEVAQILVISRDPSALALARDRGARTVQEDGTPELNAALHRATIIAQSFSARGVMIIPADMPLIQPSDIQGLIARAVNPPVIVISPDRRRDGTNALLVYPPGLIEYRYGPQSFIHHRSGAGKTAAHLEIYVNPAIELDLDLPEDLELLRNMEAVPADFL